MGTEETIAAIATAAGESGIGVVRISGPAAVGVADRSFRARKGGTLVMRRTHSISYGWVVDEAGNLIDESLALVMRGPHSFTGEDVVELQCHGGQVAVRRVLGVVLAAGARLADPGEFTKRAFLNGRLDLSQAEAVVDVIRAKTDRAMNAAVHQLRGEMKAQVDSIRSRLLQIAAQMEADIDFPELELEVETADQVEEGCQCALGAVNRLLEGARQGKLMREGFRVVLAGRPNVGKSSLLNRLVRENRAIVTEIPGTTRDVIEEWVNIAGVPVMLVDTAGIRETSDVIERLGVDRSRVMLERADMALLVVDAGDGLQEEDLALLELVPPSCTRVAVVNKIDLNPSFRPEDWSDRLRGVKVLFVSAEVGTSLGQLEAAIGEAAGVHDVEESFLVSERHSAALRRAASHLEEALLTRRAGYGSDLLSIDVRGAWVALGEITGETVGEDLIDQIFSRFCIGK